MRKLILFISLIAFVGLSAFDTPVKMNHDIQKVIGSNDVESSIDIAYDNKVIAYSDRIQMQSGDFVWQGFNKAKFEIGMAYFVDQEVCTSPNGNGMVWCCVFSDGGIRGGCYERCPYCPSPW